MCAGENHLDGKVRKTLESELEDIGDPETQQLLERKRGREKEKERLTARVREEEENRDKHDKIRRDIETRLRQLKDAQADQMRREQLQKEHERRKDLLAEIRRELADVVSSHSLAVFLGPMVDRFDAMIDDMRQRGELPSGIKQQFVDDLLSKKVCICGQDLDSNTEQRRAVEAWKAKAGLADVEETAIRMGGEMKKFRGWASATLEEIDRLQQRNGAERTELSRIERDLDDINRRLQHSPREDVRDLERRRKEVSDAISSGDVERGGLREKIRKVEEEIERLEKQLAEHENRENKQRVAQLRVRAAREACVRIREVRKLLEQKFRSELTDRVGKSFSRISVTPYFPEITDNWGLRLLESSGGQPLVVPASQGENQILSLAFIASIIELAKEEAGRKSVFGPASDVYPLVMDSPFGSLDPLYRQRIAEHVPELADQVLLMLTETQWRGDVERSLGRRVGRAYALTYHTSREDVEPIEIEIAGQTVPLVKNSPNEFEYTEIVEVDSGG